MNQSIRDYQDADNKTKNAAYTRDGGRTWTLVKEAVAPNGYRECVQYIPGGNGKYLLTVGTNGADYSEDSGVTWKPLESEGYHAIAFAPSGQYGWVSGPRGRVGRINISYEYIIKTNMETKF